MGKYDALKSYLYASELNAIRLTFSDIERILGRTLPQSAYTYSAWWKNGVHSQANAWLDAGYQVANIDFEAGTVTFSKNNAVTKRIASVTKRPAPVPEKDTLSDPEASHAADSMEVCGYLFHYVQDLIPECDSSGKAIKYYPQSEYDNKDDRDLLYHGKGTFCRFTIRAGNQPGVYLWVVDGQIIYIGETVNLQQRFNVGYGHIDCYVGQSTNRKMNKVVLENFNKGKKVRLYFHQTREHKRVELELLNQIHTPYNVKDN